MAIKFLGCFRYHSSLHDVLIITRKSRILANVTRSMGIQDNGLKRTRTLEIRHLVQTAGDTLCMTDYEKSSHIILLN